MRTVEERVAALERRAGEQTAMMSGLREAVASLDRRVGSLETRMDSRFTALESHLDQRFSAMDQRLTTLDVRMSRQFLWILGVQMTTFVAMVATFLSVFLMER